MYRAKEGLLEANATERAGASAAGWESPSVDALIQPDANRNQTNGTSLSQRHLLYSIQKLLLKVNGMLFHTRALNEIFDCWL